MRGSGSATNQTNAPMRSALKLTVARLQPEVGCTYEVVSRIPMVDTNIIIMNNVIVFIILIQL